MASKLMELNCSSSDSEDADYVPDGDHDSGDESVADEIGTENEEGEKNSPVSKVPSKRTSKKKKESSLNEPESALDFADLSTESAKKRVDVLWAKFLSDVEMDKELRKTKSDSSVSSKSSGLTSVASSPVCAVTRPIKTEENESTPEFFEFAGEIIPVVKGEISNESPLSVSSPSTSSDNKSDDVKSSSGEGTSTSSSPVVKRKGGLNAVLAIINKKQKLSTLQKSHLDWTQFKVKEGITNELAQYNRGKNAYMEKKRFLERSDLRSFELEKNARLKKRK